MILTVTLNPLLEKRIIGKKEIYKAGGKGINVSRQLNFLGINNLAYTFLGGKNGKTIRQILNEEKINFKHIPAKTETRSALITFDNNKVKTVFDPNNDVDETEVEEFKSKLEKMIYNSSIIIFSGSIPSKQCEDIIPFGIELAHRHDKISIVDTYGEHLQDCINMSPTVIHNNVQEVESSLNIKLETEKDKLDYLDYLYSKGIKLSFLTDGKNSAYVSKFDFHYKIENPKVEEADATGSGDAFMAGIIYGLEKSLVFDDFVKSASALGAANAAKLSTCDVTEEEMNRFSTNVKLFTLGKKMKIINDSPTV
ncbi:MAG: 1-phosphofructokinase [Melioribacteraceae bacterium]|nr:MAG: 1-phosphofructokinase [Melioribacteraceae bacterium]